MGNKRPDGGASAIQRAAKFLGVSVLAGAVLAGIALPAAGTLGLAAREAVRGFDELPINLKRPPLSQKTTILDADGGLIADVYSRNRTVVPLDRMSPHLQKAIVAIEDSRFYEHGAIDLKGVLRALNRNAAEGGAAEGASTLTQQYVKNVFVEEAGNDEDRVAEATRPTVGRKIKELKYAIQVEEELGKKQILENYLNITFFGQQTYGVEAASRRYFSKPAADLNLEEAALLAGIVQSPSRYDPINDPDAGLKRRNVVLQRMAAVGDISQAEADAAKQRPLGLNVSKPKNGCITADKGAGFFCDYVRTEFLTSSAYGKTREEREKRWALGGLTIRTTLSPKAQKAASDAATSKVYETDKVAASVVQVEPGTGKILSMAQSRPYGQNENQTMLNLAVDNNMGGTYAGFQPGSTFKPITAAAAIEKGISPATSFKTDWKIKMPEGAYRTCDGQSASGEWPVQNELKSEKGRWDMTSALAKSINTYFAKLEEKVGLCETLEMARKMGYHRGDGKDLQQTPSTTLGAQEASPLTMASVYATFANRGTYCTPIAITEVKDSDGKILATPKTECQPAMSERTADTVNQMLKGVVEDGTGTRAGLSDRDNAGKTGTSDERKNVWFVGYTPELSTAVWVGSDGSEQIEMTNITIGGQPYDQVCGGCLPGPIWRTAMIGALKDVTPSTFHPVDVPRDKDKKKKKKKKPGDRPKPPKQDDPPRRPDLPLPDFTLPPGVIGENDGGGWDRWP